MDFGLGPVGARLTAVFGIQGRMELPEHERKLADETPVVPPETPELAHPEPRRRSLSKVLVCVMLVIIVVSVAMFLILRPAPTGLGDDSSKPGRVVAH